MAASVKISQSYFSGKSPINKSGVVTLHGFDIRVRVQRAHLEIEDGIGQERRNIRLSRVGHRLRRLVCVSENGFVTLSALRWLADQDAAFVMLERNGKLLNVCGPVSKSDVRLKRAQALAHHNGKALGISRDLIQAKIEGQERVAREQLQDPTASELIARCRGRLADAENLDTIRHLEAQAAAVYWGAWSEVPVLFPRQDAKHVPDHWLRFGARHSPLTGQPRLAVNPPNAILNYCFALAESECRLALSGCGLDPSMGFLHVDTLYRDSLALDLLETIRPSIEAWLLAWMMQEPFRRSDFFETGTGNCRLKSRLCSQLSETAPTWGKLISPWAEYVTRSLWTGVKSGRNPSPSTTLTQQRRVQGRGKVFKVSLKQPNADHLCRGCGRAIIARRTNCGDCAIGGATERLLNASELGRVAALKPEARAKHVASRRRHAEACSQWDASTQPDWLTAQVYLARIQPLLVRKSSSEIATHIGVSRWYAGRIRKGHPPHPRHWITLAKLVSVSRA